MNKKIYIVIGMILLWVLSQTAQAKISRPDFIALPGHTLGQTLLWVKAHPLLHATFTQEFMCYTLQSEQDVEENPLLITLKVEPIGDRKSDLLTDLKSIVSSHQLKYNASDMSWTKQSRRLQSLLKQLYAQDLLDDFEHSTLEFQGLDVIEVNDSAQCRRERVEGYGQLVSVGRIQLFKGKRYGYELFISNHRLEDYSSHLEIFLLSEIYTRINLIKFNLTPQY